MTTQANFSMVPRANVVEGTMTSRLRNFLRMNPPIFRGSKVAEYTHDFIDEVYKIVCALGVTSRKKVELDSYQLKDVAKLWYTHWKGNRPEDSGPIGWK